MPADDSLSVVDALRLIQKGKLPIDDLVQSCHDQIRRLNPIFNAFITVNEPPLFEPKPNGLLNGIPLAIKDLFETKGIRTTAGSLFFKNYIPDEDAEAVVRLKNTGAALMGKTNTHEIALGVTTDNPHFGPCLNPWDKRRIPGGSSGGSAVAVATGMALAALGTDTGGSIRIPASLCGIVGLKPTYGRVSLYGVFPLSWNLDHVGPLTRTVSDAALLLQVLAGYDSKDPVSQEIATVDYLARLEEGIDGWRIAQAAGEFFESTDPEVLELVQSAASVFEQLGAKVKKVDLSFLHEAALANGQMTAADGAAYHRTRLKEHPDWFGADVRQRLESGRNLSSTEYSLARRTQAEVKQRFKRFFEQFEILLLPTTPVPAPFREGNDAVEQARRLTRYTAPFNLAGLPAISLPCGFTRDQLPVGLQLVCSPWNEAALLRAARAYERKTDWRTNSPQGNLG